MSHTMRLVIVDDEPLVRERFRYVFPLGEHGYEIIGEAEDGEEALQLCEQMQTDIVITDIVMPRMDGLELTRRLKASRPRTKVILLSNYGEFEFARRAVALGATGYTLKAASGDTELLALLEQARREIEEERARMLEQINVRRLLQQQLPVLRRQFVIDAAGGGCGGDDELARQLVDLRMHAPADNLSAALVHIDAYARLKSTFRPRDIALFRYVLIGIGEELEFGDCRCNAMSWDDGKLLLLLHWRDGRMPEERYLRCAESLFRRLTRAVGEYLPFAVSVGVSGAKPRRSGEAPGVFLRRALREALREAETAADRRFYAGHGSLTVFDGEEWLAPLDTAAERELDNALAGIDCAAGEAAALQDIRERLIDAIERAQYAPAHVVAWLDRAAERLLRHDPAGLKLAKESVCAVETLRDAELCLQELVRSRLAAAAPLPLSAGDKPGREAVERALRYIASHYHTPFSLTDICREVRMSANYFSYLFKKETGVNYTDYVTGYRMAQARRLLTETTLQVQEIACRIGVPDYKYFARLFRRTVGCTPSDYRRRGAERPE